MHTQTCPHCAGSGKYLINCPYCRETDTFEHDDLTPGECIACRNSGYIEISCPFCHGTGRSGVSAKAV